MGGESTKPDFPEGETPGQVLLYRAGDEEGPLRVQVEENTVWLPQRLIAELFQVTVPTVNEHVGNIYDEGELAPQATIRKFRIVQTEGTREVSRLVDHYNLEMILAVGYRVRSQRGTQFRQWATAQLRELLAAKTSWKHGGAEGTEFLPANVLRPSVFSISRNERRRIRA